MAIYEQMLRAEHVLGERPRLFETDDAYLARAEAAVSGVPPAPVIQRQNEAPVPARFCSWPPGAVRWTERGWEAWARHMERRTASA